MDAKSLALTLLGCFLFIIPTSLALDYEVLVTISPKEVTIAPCEPTVFDVLIENLGEMSDSYLMEVEGIPADWYSLSKSLVELDPGSSETIWLFVTPTCQDFGLHSGSISAKGLSQGSDSFSLNIVPDHVISVMMPTETSTCLCEKGSLMVTVKNSGEYVENVILKISGPAADFVELEDNAFTLAPGEEKDVTVEIKSACDLEEGSYELMVDASTDSYAASSASGTIVRGRCYDVEVSYPQEVKACEGISTSLELSTENSGEKADVYEVSIVELNYSRNLELQPAESEFLSIPLIEDEAGSYDVSFSVKSEFVSEEGTVRFIVERCYDVSLTLEVEELEVKAGSGKLISGEIENLGTKADAFTISSDLDWSTVRPTEISLNPNEARSLYVYYSPPFDAKGSHDASLTAKSEHSQDEVTLRINVLGTEVIGVEEPIVEEPIVEIPNVTIEPEITPITGMDIVGRIMESKLIKSLLIAIIAVLIITGLLYMSVMR